MRFFFLHACCASALRLAPLTLAREARIARTPRCSADALDAEVLDGILATAEEAGRAAGAIMLKKLGADGATAAQIIEPASLLTSAH